MGKIVIDTSAVMATILDEPERARLVELSRGADLLAPGSQRWELGNAFSALFRKKRLDLPRALAAVRVYETIPIQYVDVELAKALNTADTLGIYAYDAYMIVCAIDHKAPLLTLDRSLRRRAENLNVAVLEV